MYVRATTSYHTYLSDNKKCMVLQKQKTKNNLMTKNLSGAGEQGYSIICARRHTITSHAIMMCALHAFNVQKHYKKQKLGK